MKKQKLRISHFPQVPCKSFHVEVEDVDEAIKVYNLLADYDAFLLKNNHRVDYANMTTLDVWNEEAGAWETWYSDDGEDLNDVIREREIAAEGDEI